MPDIAPFELSSHFAWIRIGNAMVWILFGLVFKACGALPRHRQIVARVVGENCAKRVTSLVAFGEIGLGLWMLYGHYLVLCANFIFLSFAWYVALY